jgi:predicted secreted Zn-dependent protease
VVLNIRFSLTLPKARNSLSGSTRSAWNAFAAYARRHEERHRQIYIQCGNAFVAKAKRMTAGNCGALQASIRRQLEADKRACESRQRAFDRAERGRVSGMSLFTMARSGSRGRR